MHWVHLLKHRWRFDSARGYHPTLEKAAEFYALRFFVSKYRYLWYIPDRITLQFVAYDIIKIPKTAKKLDVYIAFFYQNEYNLCYKHAGFGKKIRWRLPWKLSGMCILIDSS